MPRAGLFCRIVENVISDELILGRYTFYPRANGKSKAYKQY